MITWEQLERLNLDEYRDAATGWGKVSSRANAAKDRVDNEMLGKLRETQKGQTADAAIGDLSRLSRNYQYIHTECGLVRTALNGLAAEMAGPQGKLKRTLADVPKTFTVKPDGSVSYPVSVPFTPGTGQATPGPPFLSCRAGPRVAPTRTRVRPSRSPRTSRQRCGRPTRSTAGTRARCAS